MYIYYKLWAIHAPWTYYVGPWLRTEPYRERVLYCHFHRALMKGTGDAVRI